MGGCPSVGLFLICAQYMQGGCMGLRPTLSPRAHAAARLPISQLHPHRQACSAPCPPHLTHPYATHTSTPTLPHQASTAATHSTQERSKGGYALVVSTENITQNWCVWRRGGGEEGREAAGREADSRATRHFAR